MVEEGRKNDPRKKNGLNIEVRTLLSQLSEDPHTVVVPTDKTNGYEVMPLSKYVGWVETHLAKDAREVERSELLAVFNQATALARSHKGALTHGEYSHLLLTIALRALPTPWLLIKNHKPRRNGAYPTRLVVPSSNFTAGFSNLGYRGIKFVLDKFGVNYSKFNIEQV